MKPKLFSAVLLGLFLTPAAEAKDRAVEKLVATMLAETPVIEDVRELTDTIGGRMTGTKANTRAVDWALKKFREAGVSARKESFTMPRFWVEKKVKVRITGQDIALNPETVSKQYSSVPAAATKGAPLLNAGSGTQAEFGALGNEAEGAVILVDTPVLNDEVGLSALSTEYHDAALIEQRARAAGSLGVVYASTRTHNLLYRVSASRGPANDLLLLIIEREEVLRLQRLLDVGRTLRIKVEADIDDRPPFTAHNVIGEIRGTEIPEQIVVVGAHLDSYDLGTGALDNGANAMMLLDIARQMTKLGLKPRRTIRFALWNGEEQGMFGSAAYTQRHRDDLDNHVMAASFDIGTGRINGFFVDGPEQFSTGLEKALASVSGMGPFAQINYPVFGTDNFDFQIFGVPNLIAKQNEANHASNYHSESDTFDKIDQVQLKFNSAIVAALTWGFANIDAIWSRRDCASVSNMVNNMVNNSDLAQGMQSYGVWDDWITGKRGCGAK